MLTTNRETPASYHGRPRRRRDLCYLLRAPAASRVAQYRGLGASVVAVESMDDFPRLAAELTFALFPEPCDGRI